MKLNVIMNKLHPRRLFILLGRKGFFNWLNDRQYLRIAFRCKMGKPLNLDNPTTYNEKLQWLKLNDRQERYIDLVDKYTVRQIIAEDMGEEYLIPLVGGPWESFEDVDFSKLPDQFVLKCTHDSGGIVLCRSKSDFDYKAAKKRISKNLRRNFFWASREWPYKHIKPQIIAEQFMVDESGTELKDYKFFCFDGVVKAMFIGSERGSADGTKFDFFDPDFNRLPIWQHYENSPKIFQKPVNYEQMVTLSERLSRGFPHVRIDLYNVNGKIYFGEFTLYHFSGMERFKPSDWDLIFGNWLTLPVKNRGAL